MIQCLVDSASELAWETPDETAEILSPMMEEDEDIASNEDDDLRSAVSSTGNLLSMAPISSISEVTLADRRSMVSMD